LAIGKDGEAHLSGLVEKIIDEPVRDRAHAGKRKPRLLFLCQTLPFPPDEGVNIRTYNIIRLLSRTFDITALCFFRKSARRTINAVRASRAGLQPYANVEAFPIPQEHSQARLVLDHLRSVLTGRVYTRFAYASGTYKRHLRELLRNQRFDLVHMDSLDLSGYLPLLDGLPVVCTHHNVESDLLDRRAQVEGSWLMRRYLAHQAKLTRAEELNWTHRVALNIAVSPVDAAVLERMSSNARVEVVPNGVDVEVFQPTEAARRGIIFVGAHGWFPNRDGMEYFAKEILPLIRRSIPEVTVTWVGRASDEFRRRFAEEHGITLTGYVDDVRPFVQEGACYVVPLRAGGGTRLKILDAWAMGKAVVSTSVGCEGLAAEDGKNILVRDTSESFARAVVDVLNNDELRSTLERGARATAEARYDWDIIGESLTSLYLDLLDTNAAVVA
jgi:polysaccharide biosynthesis protein PslH